MREQNFTITKEINIVHTAVLSSLSFAQILFLIKAIFIQEAFKNIQ